MPRIRRFHPLSHDFNRDPEVIDCRKRFGDWIALAWQECLSIGDRNDGIVRGTIEQIADILAPISLQKYHKYAANSAQTFLKHVANLGWIRIEPTHIVILNHWKYHRTQEQKPAPSEPDQTEPDLIKNKNKHPTVPRLESKPWPPEDLWLKNLIEQQPHFQHAIEPLSDFSWWEDIAAALNGIEPSFIQPEFSKMSAWLRENPGRRPTTKGARRFIRSWLERARENQRRLYAVKK